MTEVSPDYLQYSLQQDVTHLAQWLDESSKLTRTMIESLKPGQEKVPEMDVINPPYWELGHLTWFHELWVHRKGDFASPSIFKNADEFFNSSQVSHKARWKLDLPPIKELWDYFEQTLLKTKELLKNPLISTQEAYFIELSIFHEDMHNEAFAYSWQTLEYSCPQGLFPLFTPKKIQIKQALIDFPARVLQLGSSPQSGFVFDNEKWQHEKQIPAFSISNIAVSNAEYLEFIESNASANIPAPSHWRQDSGQWHERHFNQWQPLALEQPVRHISADDAQRYCLWRNLRLPTEEELLVLLQSPQDIWVSSNLWEWTSSVFQPFSGFSPDPYADYSKPWFDGSYRVLKGGSIVTPKRLLRPQFRNFYRPERKDFFCGFRTCLL